MSDPSTQAGDNATLKDVYDLVDKRSSEANARIDVVGAKLDGFITLNEHRLTVVETHQAAQAEQLNAVVSQVTEHAKDIGAIKDKQRADEAVTQALTNTKSGRKTMWQWLIGSAVGAVGTAAMLISVLH